MKPFGMQTDVPSPRFIADRLSSCHFFLAKRVREGQKVRFGLIYYAHG